jgi:hypothetical protein
MNEAMAKTGQPAKSPRPTIAAQNHAKVHLNNNALFTRMSLLNR